MADEWLANRAYGSELPRSEGGHRGDLLLTAKPPMA